jgi:hypothetical protein
LLRLPLLVFANIIGYWEKNFRQKLAKIAENCGRNIDPWTDSFVISTTVRADQVPRTPEARRRPSHGQGWGTAIRSHAQVGRNSGVNAFIF